MLVLLGMCPYFDLLPQVVHRSNFRGGKSLLRNTVPWPEQETSTSVSTLPVLVLVEKAPICPGSLVLLKVSLDSNFRPGDYIDHHALRPVGPKIL